jgi:hypothetical protein
VDDAIFAASLQVPWGVLGLLSSDNQSWLLGNPAARVPRARQAIIDASLAVRTSIAHELGAVLGPRSRVMVGPSDCSTFALAVVRRDDRDTQDDGPELAEGAQ